MRAVRSGQAERRKEISGGIFIDEAQEAAIAAAVASSNLVQAVKDAVQMKSAVSRAARLFEEMCRRQHVDISESMRPQIVRLLASELLVNQEALPEVAKERLVPLTVLQCAIGPELKKEFSGRVGGRLYRPLEFRYELARRAARWMAARLLGEKNLMTAFEQIWGRAKQTGIGGLVVVAKPEDTQMLRDIARACGREDGLIVCSEIPHTTTE